MTDSWLPQSGEDDEQKALRKRLAKERSIQGTVEKLDELRARPKEPVDPATQTDMVKAAAEAMKKKDIPLFKPSVHLPHQQQRTEPKLVSERPDPKVISEGYQPRVAHQVDDPPAANQPSPVSPTPQTKPAPGSTDNLAIEFFGVWRQLSIRDRTELLLMAKVKAHLNGQGK